MNVSSSSAPGTRKIRPSADRCAVLHECGTVPIQDEVRAPARNEVADLGRQAEARRAQAERCTCGGDAHKANAVIAAESGARDLARAAARVESSQSPKMQFVP